MSARLLLVAFLLQSMVALGSDYAQKADEYVQHEFDAGRFAGSVMVARSNRIVFMKGYQCWRERKILSASSWTAMTTAGEWHYGFGMWISEHFRQTTQKVFEHGGHVNGFASSMKWFPNADLFVAAFANWDSARTGEIAENLAAIMFDLPVTLSKERTATEEQRASSPAHHITEASGGGDLRSMSLGPMRVGLARGATRDHP